MNPLNTWTLGVLIGLPAAALILVASVAGLAYGHRWRKAGYSFPDFRDEMWPLMVVGCPIVAALTLIVTAAALFPYEVQYHQFRDVSGVVTDVGHRQIADGKGMSERYVFVIDGARYGVDDTRASLVKIGDRVELSCIKTWEWAATPGDVCRWIA